MMEVDAEIYIQAPGWATGFQMKREEGLYEQVRVEG